MEDKNLKPKDICGSCGKAIDDHWLLLLTKLNSVDPADRRINSRLCDDCAKKINLGLDDNDRN